jgi:hypothetical protein
MPSFSCIIVRSTIGLAIFGFAFAKAGIDFTPAVSEYVAEGVKFQQLTFRYNKQRIEYEPPRAWIFDGGSTALHLKPPQKSFAEGVIEAEPLSKPQLLDESVQKSLGQKLIANLPAGSQLVKVEQEIESPLLVNGNRTFEVIVSYQLMGEKFIRSALFANLPDVQLIFRFTARKDDFDPLHREFRASILSWHSVEAADAKQVTSAAGSKQLVNAL